MLKSESNTKNLTAEEQQERKKMTAKSSNIRGLINIKGLMDKRKQQRSMATYYLINGKFQSALIIGRQLMFSSQKIWKEFQDEYRKDFEQQFFFLTSKAKQHAQHLLDCVLLCKIFIAGKKRQDAVDILDKLEVPLAPLTCQKIQTAQEKLQFNEAHEIYSKTCASLLYLIEITKTQKLHEYTEKLFSKYLKFVKKYYGQIEYGTALFKHATYLYEAKLYEQAEKEFQKCIQIRKRNVYNGGLIDALVNSAICLKQLYNYETAVQRVKSAIEITRDIIEDSQQIDNYYLFLAKLYFQMGKFENAYKNYVFVLKLRQDLQKGNPKKIETELNLIFFYKTLKEIVQNPTQHLNLTEKKELQTKKQEAKFVVQLLQDNILQREDFAKYKQFKSSKLAHLHLTIQPQFFEMLTSEQIEELNDLRAKLAEVTYMRGVLELQNTSFYKQKKTRDVLLEGNPDLRSIKPKK